MRFYQWLAIFSTIFGLSYPLCSSTTVAYEQLQIPHCLATQLPMYPIMAQDESFTIINVPSADINKIAHIADQIHCGRFINVSQHLQSNRLIPEIAAKDLLAKSQEKKPARTQDYSIDHQTTVIKALSDINVDYILATLTHLTNFHNRSAIKSTGVAAANWLKASFESLAHQYKRTDIEAYFVKTGSHYKQPSLVTVIGKDIKAPAIVIGAHMDTLDGYMPGAGDDASGCASMMEMARVLLGSSIDLKRPVYFIWYAAEERGLVGSQYVVEDFLKKEIEVRAAIQFDMTGFRNNRRDATMWVYRDYTDNELSTFTATLIRTYIGVPVAESTCGYGCSDHVSWMNAGIPAAFPCETDFDNHNPNIHTSRDSVDKLTPEHMVNFTKLGLAFAIELACK